MIRHFDRDPSFRPKSVIGAVICHFDRREKSCDLRTKLLCLFADQSERHGDVCRIYEYKNKVLKGFTEKYNINKLVYFEHTTDVTAALEREKEIKKWRRKKKNNLVQDQNPAWEDLSEEWGGRFLPLVEMTFPMVEMTFPIGGNDIPYWWKWHYEGGSFIERG